MSTTQLDISPELRRTGRRIGYVIAVAFNVAMLAVVPNLLDWGWPAFLTDEFVEVVPWISFSLAASIVANVVYWYDDAPAIRSVGGLVTNAIGLVVSYRMLRAFPFDFSTYDFDWSIVVTVILILAMVGSGIGMFVEARKLASLRPDERGR